MILISVRTIYSQISINFRIIGNSGDNWAKGKYTKLKRESWNTSTFTKVAQIRKKAKMPLVDLAQASGISFERDNANNV